MFDTSAKPVQFPDNQGVAVAESLLYFRESRPLGMTSADLVVEDLLAACLPERLGLEIEILVLGGDAGIADQNINLFDLSRKSWLCHQSENSI